MIHRNLHDRLVDALSRFPVVALLGPRQVGKTTLARQLAQGLGQKSVYLDLERPSDAAKLADPELYLGMHADGLVILDEIQRVPELFPVLRSLVDARRTPGRFLVLGSASPELIRQSSETLAGRILFQELTPFQIGEVDSGYGELRRLWFRGGFPGSFLADTDAHSLEWREAFIATYLERDLPMLGIRVAPATLRRFWTMLAHSHGQIWNASKISNGLGVSAPAVKHYLDVLHDTFLVRQLQPFHANLKKQVVKRPKAYIRDSGLLHALLRIETIDDLHGHPVIGSSWEGWVCEQLLSAADRSQGWFYRTGAGAEIDLLLERPGGRPPLAFEIKYSSTPTLSRGFWTALADLGLGEGFVVCPCNESYPLGRGVHTLPATQLAEFAANRLRRED